MITNTITIVVIIVMSLSIVSTSVVFAESQEYDPRSQEDVTFEEADYDQYVRPQSNSDYEQDTDYNQYVRPQSHGFIKNKDIGVLVYTHGNPMMPHTADTMKTELIEKI